MHNATIDKTLIALLQILELATPMTSLLRTLLLLTCFYLLKVGRVAAEDVTDVCTRHLHDLTAAHPDLKHDLVQQRLRDIIGWVMRIANISFATVWSASYIIRQLAGN